MAQTNITIDQLAEMINEGFKTTATKEDVAALHSEMTAGFERIEHLLLAEQTRKIEDLEKRMKRLEDAPAV
jgi:L-2-hydroxyglutarate oxidase LhgO